MEKPERSNWFAPSFMLNLIVVLVGLGIAFGTIKLSLTAIEKENVRQDAVLKEIQADFLRIDLYEARHKALEDQIHDMVSDVKEIKRYVMMGK